MRIGEAAAAAGVTIQILRLKKSEHFLIYGRRRDERAEQWRNARQGLWNELNEKSGT